MKKKLLSVIMVLCLMLAIGTAALADGVTNCPGGEECTHEAAIGGTHYATLEEAITAATSGATINIINDVDADVSSVTQNNNGVFEIKKSLTINGNDHMVRVSGTPQSNTNVHVFNVNGNGLTVTLNELSIYGTTTAGTAVGKHGINVFSSDGTTTVYINNVDSFYNIGYGVCVNGGNVIATDLYTAGNGWGGVNVDPNQSNTASFSMSSGMLQENASIVLDSSTNQTNTVTLTGGSYMSVMTNTPDDGTERSEGTNNISISNGAQVGQVSLNGVGDDVVEISNARIGSVTNGHTGTENNGTVSVVATNTSFDTQPAENVGAVLTNCSVNGAPVDDTVPEGIVAVIGGKQYETLEAAIADASDNDVITLVNDADIAITAGSPLKIDDNITIDGNGMHIINISLTNSARNDGRDKILQIDGAALVLKDVELNITGFNDSTKGYCGDAIDFPNSDAYLTISNSQVNISNVAAAFVLQDTPENIVISNSTVDINDVRGNASQGGNWTVTNSSLSIDGTGDLGNGLSVESIEITNSDVVVRDVGLYGLTGSYITLNAGANVVIDNGGRYLPHYSEWADTWYNYPVVVKSVAEDASLKVNNGASLSVINCVNKETKASNNVIYIPDNADYTSTGTVDATIELGNEEMNLVTVINRNSTSTVLVADGVSFPLSSPGTYNGYTFGGWRGSNGLVYKAGDSVVINSDMTFTAIWNAINVPDTHNITIANTVNGTVSTNFSNASAGSTVTITAAPADGYAVSSVAVTGPDGRVNVTRVDATTYTFVMPDGAVTVSVSFGPATVTLPFTDVTTGDWFYDEVAYVYANGLMDGVSATRFDPNGTMTRAMVWAILARVDGQTVTGDNWIETARAWAMAEGVSDGENATGAVTREQLVTMLWRYAGEPAGTASLSAYTDAGSVSDWASTAMSWAIANGIIEGMSADTIVPGGTATRAQCAAILMRYVEGVA